MQWSSYVVSAIDNPQSKGFLQHLYNLIVDKKDTTLALSDEQAHVEHKAHIFYHVLISKTLVTLQTYAAKVFKETDITRSAFSQLAWKYKYGVSINLEKLIRENQPVVGWAIDDLSITIGILLDCIVNCGDAIGPEADMTDGKLCLLLRNFLLTSHIIVKRQFPKVLKYLWNLLPISCSCIVTNTPCMICAKGTKRS